MLLVSIPEGLPPEHLDESIGRGAEKPGDRAAVRAGAVRGFHVRPVCGQVRPGIAGRRRQPAQSILEIVGCKSREIGERGVWRTHDGPAKNIRENGRFRLSS
jgi:hypothetical protein